jgi:hypothetical protein
MLRHGVPGTLHLRRTHHRHHHSPSLQMQLLPVLVATWLSLNIDFWFIELLRGSVELWAGLNLRFFCSRFQ